MKKFSEEYTKTLLIYLNCIGLSCEKWPSSGSTLIPIGDFILDVSLVNRRPERNPSNVQPKVPHPGTPMDFGPMLYLRAERIDWLHRLVVIRVRGPAQLLFRAEVPDEAGAPLDAVVRDGGPLGDVSAVGLDAVLQLFVWSPLFI